MNSEQKIESRTSDNIIIIIIIIVVIIIITISFMQGIYTYIPETSNVLKEYNVSAILSLLCMVPKLLLLLLLLLTAIVFSSGGSG
jgi:choline-glycine betaine transporter